jgi:hypothetical protein
MLIPDKARPSEVSLMSGPLVFSCHDMVNHMGKQGIVFVKEAIFTPTASSLPDQIT